MSGPSTFGRRAVFSLAAIDRGPGSLVWFAGHELRLAWRDWAALMSGGRRLQDNAILLGMALFAIALHGIAYALLNEHFAVQERLGLPTLATLSVALVLSFTMMLSQALESVTRAFYSRDDLDLILSSPASSRHLFTVRIALMALTTAAMSGLMLAPFINVAAWLGGAQWLSGYLVVVAVSALATGAAVGLALILFRTVGPRRTRLAAQILAAVVGASFLIGLQVVAILSYGSMSRWSLLDPRLLAEAAPPVDSLLWLPAAAVTGDAASLFVVVGVSAAAFAAATSWGAGAFRRIVVTAAGLSTEDTRGDALPKRPFRSLSTPMALVRKEWLLLGRDPWLLSQTLMQILYLVPPGLMLWVNFGHEADLPAILAPVIVMAIGQLAGGLSWLTISGEDAPDLVATAPVPAATLVGAKVAAVAAIVAAIVAPMVIGLALLSVWGALATLIAAMLAAGCAILIQFWFRRQAKRSNFRRRQVASKASTFAEAFASISCAGLGGLLAAGNPMTVLPAVLLALVMGIAWTIRPRRD